MAESVYDIIAKFNFQVNADPLKLILNDLSKLITLTKTQETAAKTAIATTNVATRAVADNTKAKIVQEKVEKEILKTIALNQKMRLAEQKSLEDSTNAYKQLSNQFNITSAKAKSYALQLGANHPTTLAAINDARNMNAQLKALDLTVGQHGRNVGNYNAVGAQFNQLLRELPNLAISPRTFIMSLSNNISYFGEAVGAARKQGQSWGEVLKSVGSSAFGLVGVLNIAAFAITLFSSKLFESGKAAKEAKSEYESFIESLQKSTETALRNTDEQIVKQRTLLGVLKDSNATEDQRKKALEELKSQGLSGDAKTIEGQIKANEASLDIQRKIVEAKQQVRDIDKQIAEQEQKVSAARRKAIQDQEIAEASVGDAKERRDQIAFASAQKLIAAEQTLSGLIARRGVTQNVIDIAQSQASAQLVLAGGIGLTKDKKDTKDPYKAAIEQAEAIAEQQKALDEDLNGLIIQEIELNDKYRELYFQDIVQNRQLSEDERLLREESYSQEQTRLNKLQELRLTELDISLLNQKEIIASNFNKVKDIGKFQNAIRDEVLKQTKLRLDINAGASIIPSLGQRRSTFTPKPIIPDKPIIGVGQTELEKFLFGHEKYKDFEEKRRDEIMKTVDAYNTLTGAVINSLQTIAQAQQIAIDREIEVRKTRVQAATELAERGNAEILKQEQDRLDEALKAREDAARRQLVINAALQTSNALVAVAQAAATGPAAIVLIPAIIAAIIAGYSAVSAATQQTEVGFKKGGYTGEGGENEPAGTVHRGEFVFTKKRTKEIGIDKLEALHKGRELSMSALTPNEGYARKDELKGVINKLADVEEAIKSIRLVGKQTIDKDGAAQFFETTAKKSRNRWK